MRVKYLFPLRLLFLTATSCLATNGTLNNLQGSYGSTLRFAIIGDSGREDHYSRHAADVLDKEHGKQLDFVLLIGDNFYESGISSSHSSRFQSTFENIFKRGHLKDKQFFAINGNHEYRGNWEAPVGSSQSSMWNQPDLWYKIKNLYFDDFSVTVLMIDTNILKHEQSGLENLEKQQYRWLEEELIKAQSSDYRIVAGHHPFGSIGSHGSYKEKLEKLLQLLRKYDVHLYLSGHDHNMQVAEDHFDGKIHYHFVTGNGAKRSCSKPHHHSKSLPSGFHHKFFYCSGASHTRGYSYVTIDGSGLDIYHFGVWSSSSNPKTRYHTRIPRYLAYNNYQNATVNEPDTEDYWDDDMKTRLVLYIVLPIVFVLVFIGAFFICKK